MLTMLLGGLWHGASWRFVAWGGLHGLFLIGERLWRGRRGSHATPPRPAVEPEGGRWQEIPAMLLTFALVNLTWVFFRAPDFPAALHLIRVMLGGTVDTTQRLISSSAAMWVLGMTGCMLAFQWMFRNASLEQVVARWPWWVRGVVLALMLFVLVNTNGSGTDHAFIYFQF